MCNIYCTQWVCLWILHLSTQRNATKGNYTMTPEQIKQIMEELKRKAVHHVIASQRAYDNEDWENAEWHGGRVSALNEAYRMLQIGE